MAATDTSTMEKTLLVPISVLRQILDQDSSEPLEDWLMVTNEKFLLQLTKADKDLKAGKELPWEMVKKQLNIILRKSDYRLLY